MSELSSKPLDFPALRSLRSSDRECPRHHVKMVYLPGHEPFCMVCTRENIDLKNQAIADEAKSRFDRYHTVGVMRRDSIIDDDDVKPATFDNYEPNSEEAIINLKLARNIAKDYLSPKAKYNTILTGLPGRGKSHLALAMLKAVNQHSQVPMSCLFVSVNKLMRLIRSSFDYPDSKYTEANMIELCVNADLLVLDDLGSEASFKQDTSEASEFVQRVLFGILDDRNRTIITTNLKSEQLAKIYNPKLLSRMYKGINGHIIKFTEETPDKREEVSF
ncbi:DNA replication protein [Lactobacillus plantarum] [Lactiplantibacillus mudanjiangensis]|uniref:ATP-binding protein n=1 Tax=Lactiplantibacillus mudanjiangensis TaxID=1296538 RepID=UPI0010156597|nr:ATP-binding protein [Lactiplantibacillus mudanjiangensis]VDG31462.1 DNA replication protein [Lactobacillus plantarum] [Lactiplantibacillus mudanjiangensis]